MKRERWSFERRILFWPKWIPLHVEEADVGMTSLARRSLPDPPTAPSGVAVMKSSDYRSEARGDFEPGPEEREPKKCTHEEKIPFFLSADGKALPRTERMANRSALLSGSF